MPMFIDVQVDPKVTRDPDLVKALVESCPVDIFGRNEAGHLNIVQENLDECTLCDLCKHAAPKGTVRIVKLYEL